MKTYTGRRGMSFENLINMSNAIYERKGKAVINKRSTPMKIIGETKGGQHLCVFSEKSTVDYDGVYRGRSIQFEAKTIKEKRFPLNKITDDQIDFLNRSEAQGAICFLLVEMRARQTIYLVPNQMLQKYIRDAKNGARKSIPIDDMGVYAWLVESRNGVPLAYLDVVDKLIKEKVVG